MAPKYLNTDEAAKLLGVTSDELNLMRERRQLFGIRDGSSWKYKQQDLERAKEDMAGEGSSIGSEFPLSIDEREDSVLLSEVELGEPGTGQSGTVIGKPGSMSAVDSDIELFEPADKVGGSSVSSDSDVTLVPDLGTSAGDSGVRLVAAGDVPAGNDPMSNTVELELSDLALDDDDTDLPFDLGGSGTGDSKLKKAIQDAPSAGIGSDLMLGDEASSGGDDLKFGSGLGLSDEPSKSMDAPSSGTGSAIELGGSAFEDDDLVLGSHTGSDISDSGISLGSPVDSGLSLEQPLELGGDELLIDEGGSGTAGELAADDEFLLTPAVDMGEEDLDESGSQVIALDTEGDFDDSAATMLGGAPSGPAGMLEEDPFAAAAAPGIDLGGGAMMGAPTLGATQTVVAREAPYSVLNIISLMACLFFLMLTGMMMFDLMRNMWTWDGPVTMNSSIMDAILGIFES
jgi:hypothetical protein